MKTQKINLLALACGVLSLAFTTSAHAQTIANGDFSTGDTTDFTTDGPVGVDGPTLNPVSTGVGSEYTGPTYPTSDDPTTAVAPHTSNDAVANFAFIYTYGTLSQAITFKADTAYTLTVDVAQSANFTPSIPFYSIDDGDVTTPVPAMSVSNLVSNTLTFTTNTIDFTTVKGGLGYIEFGNDPQGNKGGYDGANVADFTNISLSGVSLGGSVPEPSTWALMLLGLGGLGFVIRLRSASRKS